MLLKEAYNLPSKDLTRINQKERQYYSVVREVVAELLGKKAGGEVLTAVTFSLLGMCNWIYSWYDPEGPINPERLSNIVTAIFTEGAGRVVGRTQNG